MEENERNFYCPLDVGFLSNELSTLEALERFLSYYGIAVIVEGRQQKEQKKEEIEITKK